MAYQKHNFKEGDKLFVAQKNTFETQVVKNEQKDRNLKSYFGTSASHVSMMVKEMFK